jgi:voltage-gated potassium channel
MNALNKFIVSAAFSNSAKFLAFFGIIALSLLTLGNLDNRITGILEFVLISIWFVFGLEIICRLISQTEKLPKYSRSVGGLFDLVAVVLPALGLAAGLDRHDVALICAVWIFKFAHETAALTLLRSVLTNERRILTSVLSIFFIVLFLAATLAYVLERQSGHETFASIPAALWWAITTLTTTGYGDAVPSSIAGRLLAGVVMTSGIAVFALWAGILATGFAKELRRHEFLRNWDLVARVPLLADLDAKELADIVRLLRSRDVANGAVICRQGDPGDQMYFIVEGTVQVSTPQPIWLGPGDYFGELALITGEPRIATVAATAATSLLVLDVSDFRMLLAGSPEIASAINSVAKQRLEALKQDT